MIRSTVYAVMNSEQNSMVVEVNGMWKGCKVMTHSVMTINGQLLASSSRCVFKYEQSFNDLLRVLMSWNDYCTFLL